MTKTHCWVAAKHAPANFAEDAFNYFQSNLRMNIECAFGILVQRWGVLWRPMRVSYRKVPRVVELCMMLHNYCLDTSSGFHRSREEHWADQGVPRLNLNEEFIEGTGKVINTVIPKEAMTPGRRRDLESSLRREKICHTLRQMHRGRPAHSSYGKTSQVHLHDYDYS